MSADIAASTEDTVFIHLVSNDDKSFTVNWKAAKKSTVISDVLEATSADPSSSPVSIPMPKVASAEMQKIIAFLENHKNDAIDSAEWREKLVKKEADALDMELVETDISSVSLLMLAADFMDIPPLVTLCAWKMSEEIKKCKTAADIRTAFDETSDFTEEEAKALEEEYAWYPNK